VLLGGENALGSINLEVDLIASAWSTTLQKPVTHVPVHEVEVKVLEAEVLQGVLDGELDVFGVVVQLEELGGHKDLLTGDTGVLDTLSDLSLVTVGPGTAVQSALALEWLAHVTEPVGYGHPLNVPVAVLRDQLLLLFIRFLLDLP
jgi:hypothetical protein